MSRQIQIRRGTAAEHSNFTGVIGEITMDTTNNNLRIHDGSTVGGHIIPNKTEIYTKNQIDNLLLSKANNETTLSGYGITDGVDIKLSNIDSDGKKVCSNMAMPSSTYDTLTIGASGATYTAPADGYVAIRLNLNSSGYMSVNIHNKGLTWMSGTSTQTSCFLPVSKGQTWGLNYNNRNSQNFEFMIFIYANGAI